MVNPRDLVDTELLAALDQWPVKQPTLEGLRARRDALPAMLPSPESYARPGIAMETRLVPGSHGAPDVPVYLYRPAASDAAQPAYLHIHGGGYVFGNAEMMGHQKHRVGLGHAGRHMLTQRDSSEARNRMSPTRSCGSPKRPSGICAMVALRRSGSA